MQPENALDRTQRKKDFLVSYTGLILLIILYFYLSFGLIPRIDRKHNAVTNEQLNSFLVYVNETDKYLDKIEQQQDISQVNATTIFTRLDQLKAAYPQTFFQASLTSFELRITEAMNNNSNDSTLTELKEELKKLKEYHETLAKQKEELTRDIRAARANIQ